ncbi:MAG: hypothetical protein ACYSVY_24350, partial [Planctomycetota bacterium]
MAIPTDKLYNIDRLNVWFAVSSALMLVVVLWLAWVDYDRPWHDHQDDYGAAQSSLAHLDYLRTQQQTAQEELQRAAAALEEARRQVAEEDAGTRASLTESLARLQAEFDEIRLEYAAADAVIQVTASEFEHLLGEYGPQHHKTQAAMARLEAERAELNELRLSKERVEDAQQQLRVKLAELDQPVTDAQRDYDQLAKSASDAAKKEDQYGNRWVKGLINLPFLDFAAPKGTPARHEVRQLVLPEVRQRLNYLDSYTTDRCTTCHVAIDNPDFSPDRLAAKLEESLGAINEERRRQNESGIALPTVPELSGEEAPTLEAGRVYEHWEALSKDQQDDYFCALLDAVNTYLEEAGRPPLELGQPVMAHPDLELFVSVDSPHPMAKLGCTVCHEGNPQETDFVLAAHTPKDHEEEHEWIQEHYVRRLGLPTATFELVEHYWDRPMLPGKYAEAGCAKCHQQISDIGSYENKPQGRSINFGENLFVNTGCINCHLVQGMNDARRVGPDLTHVSSKLSPGFTDQWVFNPRAFRPSTWMPHFFAQENNGPAGANDHDPDPVLRSETEVMAIRTYLFELSADWAPEPLPEGLTGDAQRGRTL